MQDRIKNYFQKYVPASLEVTEEAIREKGGEPGTPEYQTAREELIAAHLNARPKKPSPEEAEPAPPPPPAEAHPPLRRGYRKASQ